MPTRQSRRNTESLPERSFILLLQGVVESLYQLLIHTDMPTLNSDSAITAINNPRPCPSPHWRQYGVIIAQTLRKKSRAHYR